MKITTAKEYYRLQVELEEFLEKGLDNLTGEEENRLTIVTNSIREWEEEQNKTEPEELTERYWIEATDRTDFVNSVVQILLEHPCIAQTPELKEKVEEAQGILFDVYKVCAENY